MFSLLSEPILQANAAVDATVLGNTLSPIISNIVYPVLGLLFGVAVVVFVYGVLQMIIKGGDEDARSKGKMMILYGVLGLFIMVSAWGIIYLISNTVKAL